MAALERGDIKFLRSAWLLARPAGYRIPRRQDLEALENDLQESELTPFLTIIEATVALRRGNRGIGILSHGWLSPGDCDPHGAKVAMVQAALREEKNEHLNGIFWECALPLRFYRHYPDF